MAQTTDQMSARALKVEVNVNGGGYTDISGFAVSVEPGGEERDYSEQHTFDGDSPLLGFGKLSAAEATLKAVYTQADSDPFDEIWDAKKAHQTVALRWSVPGGASSDKQYECSGYCVACTPPGGESSSSDVVLFEAKIVAQDFDESTVA